MDNLRLTIYLKGVADQGWVCIQNLNEQAAVRFYSSAFTMPA